MMTLNNKIEFKKFIRVVN